MGSRTSIQRYLFALIVSYFWASPGDARTLVGTHPGTQWLDLSPDGHWLDAGSASAEGSGSETWRYDLWRGGHRNLGYAYGFTWLPNGLVADVAGTEADNLKATTGLEDVAPVVSLARPSVKKPLHIYRDHIFARDPYNGVRLSQNRRHLLIYSRRWVRRFDVRTGRLLSRTKWPLPNSSDYNYVRSDISPDGRWIVAIRDQSRPSGPNGEEREKRFVQLYDQQGRVKRNLLHRSTDSVISSSVWLTPTLFYLTRNWTSLQRPDLPRTFTEFYDARTLKRLWVLSDYAVREQNDDHEAPSPTFYYRWRSHYLIPQKQQLIVCGKNIWTWRDLHTGKIVRQGLRPTAWTLDRTDGRGVSVDGDFYYWFDSKGRIWRDHFHFLPRSR